MCLQHDNDDMRWTFEVNSKGASEVEERMTITIKSC